MSIGKVSGKRKVATSVTIAAVCGLSILFMDNYDTIEGFTNNVVKSTSLVKSDSHTNIDKLKNTSDTSNTISKVKEWNIGEKSNDYNLSYNENNEVLLKFSNTQNNTYITKEVPLSYVDGELTNSLSLKFKNINNSISQISFYLQGDEKMLVGSGDNQYMEYFEEKIGDYKLENSNKSDAINMTIDIEESLKELEGHMTNGVRLAMRVESDSDYQDLYDRQGEMILESVEALSIKYGENTLTPWAYTNGYNINNNVVTYENLNDFENISSEVKNYNPRCRYFNLEIKNIDNSVENIVINVYGKNNEVANINIDLTKKSKTDLSFQYDILEYNNKLGNIEKVELLVDSNPYNTITNRSGQLEIVSAYFSSFEK
ncbi:hypothetical protein [Romboutsia sp. 1001713B170207_170306_H8]|uniref:hypothetical protein n=1 Tax=Romboutsia sp. 1001713B170207_170306_H8 TaxID=2787112 RepID=UPI000821A67D|nr:hypothetical protein [Romboutsia sp. 1001713B170207_170306_H8]SCI49743.1 Uncharacterised protein [uncultured Clostridium sp.]